MRSLALYIEELFYQKSECTWDLIHQELDVLKANNLDFLILGCTHYPLIAKQIEKYIEVKTVDPHLYVVKQLVRSTQLTKQEGFSQINFSSNLGEEWNTREFPGVTLDE